LEIKRNAYTDVIYMPCSNPCKVSFGRNEGILLMGWLRTKATGLSTSILTCVEKRQASIHRSERIVINFVRSSFSSVVVGSVQSWSVVANCACSVVSSSNLNRPRALGAFRRLRLLDLGVRGMRMYSRPLFVLQ
jgi:hypothetical protein